jgi:hypothetical protein
MRLAYGGTAAPPDVFVYTPDYAFGSELAAASQHLTNAAIVRGRANREQSRAAAARGTRKARQAHDWNGRIGWQAEFMGMQAQDIRRRHKKCCNSQLCQSAQSPVRWMAHPSCQFESS